MAFFDPDTGTLRFPDGPTFCAAMGRDALLGALAQADPLGDPPGDGDFVPFPALRVPGGRVAPVCELRRGALCAVTLHAVAAAQHEPPDADQARALLYQLIGCADPSPDTRAPVQLRCAFGTLVVASDPRTGRALLRVRYEQA